MCECRAYLETSPVALALFMIISLLELLGCGEHGGMNCFLHYVAVIFMEFTECTTFLSPSVQVFWIELAAVFARSSLSL